MSLASADIHITIRAWHFCVFLVSLMAIWHLQAPTNYAVRRNGIGEGRRMHRRSHYGATSLAQSQLQPHYGATPLAQQPQPQPRPRPHQREEHPPSLLEAPKAEFELFPPPPPPPRPLRSPAARSIVEASTAALIGELHSRSYDWEVLEVAGLRFSSFKELELLSYLRRNASQFRQYLTKASLGLSAHSTSRLLRAVSRRPDLAAALRETGLGAGSDFHCTFDESPREAGCQMRCSGGNCARAEQRCAQLGHCISLDVNRDHSWATLKSLQVFMPVPPPTCEGYAFSADGSPTVPVAAPQAIVFDDLPPASSHGGLALPNEAWCYRDTSVTPGYHLAGSSWVPSASRPASPGDAGVPPCSLESCFDLERCHPAPGESASSPLRLFIDTPVPPTPEMARWPRCMRQTMNSAMVGESRGACLVIPTVNINCAWDQCDPATHSKLRSMPSWNESGRNHIIWDYIDGYRIKYRTDQALYMKTAMKLSEYRTGLAFCLAAPL